LKLKPSAPEAGALPPQAAAAMRVTGAHADFAMPPCQGQSPRILLGVRYLASLAADAEDPRPFIEAAMALLRS
jgi:hypothetical protein